MWVLYNLILLYYYKRGPIFFITFQPYHFWPQIACYRRRGVRVVSPLLYRQMQTVSWRWDMALVKFWVCSLIFSVLQKKPLYMWRECCYLLIIDLISLLGLWAKKVSFISKWTNKHALQILTTNSWKHNRVQTILLITPWTKKVQQS